MSFFVVFVFFVIFVSCFGHSLVSPETSRLTNRGVPLYLELS